MRGNRLSLSALALLCAAAVGSCGTVRLPVAFLGLGPRCPLEDQSICDFVLNLEAALESGDVQAFLDLVQLLDCQQYGHGFYGPVPEDFCGSSQWCFWESPFFGEGACVPLPDPAAIEDVLGTGPGWPSADWSVISRWGRASSSSGKSLFNCLLNDLPRSRLIEVAGLQQHILHMPQHAVEAGIAEPILSVGAMELAAAVASTPWLCTFGSQAIQHLKPPIFAASQQRRNSHISMV